MKLLIAGYFGCGNLGDEAILEALITKIGERLPNTEITVISGNPHETADCYNVKAINKNNIINIFKAIKSCDSLIFGGGGVLQDRTSLKSLIYYLSLIFIAKHCRKKIILIGQGIGPVKRKYLLKKALSGADLIALRDEDSYKEIIKLGIKANKIALTADMAFLLKTPDKQKADKLMEIEGIKKCKSRLIGVSVRPFIGVQDQENKYKTLAALCDHLIKNKDSQIVFLIFKYPEDMEVINKIMGMMKYPAHVVLRQCKPSDMLGMISRFDAVIGMRLHSLIFSALAKVPSLGLSYDPKVSIFQRQINRKSIEASDINDEILIKEADKFLEKSESRSFEVELLAAKSQMNIDLMMDRLKNNKVHIMGLDIDNVSMKEAVKTVQQLLESHQQALIVTPNPEMIMAAQKDYELAKIVNHASLAPADGVGLMLAGRILNKKFKERVAGIDLMMKIIELARERGLRIFLYGGREGVAEQAATKIKANVAGTMHGYSLNEHIVIDKIRSAKPDILFVGLGSPKQEKWAVKHQKDLNVPLIMCIGGSFDVISGRVQRAPFFMRKAGLEWLWRLITEPGRWRRMLVLPRFILKVIRSKY